MASIDLRKGEDIVNEIIFGEEGESIYYDPSFPDVITIIDKGTDISLYLSDAPLLIQAIQKALELWQPKK